MRDGVALSEYKTARTGAKYDMEVIETGAEGYFFMELVIRERDRETKMLEQIRQVFEGWSREDERLWRTGCSVCQESGIFRYKYFKVRGCLPDHGRTFGTSRCDTGVDGDIR